MPPRFLAIIWGSKWRVRGSKRDHVHKHHLLIVPEIARHEGTAIAESRVVNQKIDINLFALETVPT